MGHSIPSPSLLSSLATNTAQCCAATSLASTSFNSSCHTWCRGARGCWLGARACPGRALWCCCGHVLGSRWQLPADCQHRPDLPHHCTEPGPLVRASSPSGPTSFHQPPHFLSLTISHPSHFLSLIISQSLNLHCAGPLPHALTITLTEFLSYCYFASATPGSQALVSDMPGYVRFLSWQYAYCSCICWYYNTVLVHSGCGCMCGTCIHGYSGGTQYHDAIADAV